MRSSLVRSVGVLGFLLLTCAGARAQDWAFALDTPEQSGARSVPIVFSGTITNHTGAVFHLAPGNLGATVYFESVTPPSDYTVRFSNAFTKLKGAIPTTGYHGPVLEVTWKGTRASYGSGVVVLTAAASQMSPPITSDYFAATVTPRMVLNLNELHPGQETAAEIVWNQPAPAGGRVIKLVSSDKTRIVVPASVTMPEGANRVTFLVKAAKPTFDAGLTPLSAVIKATSGPTTLEADATVYPWLLGVFCEDPSLHPGETTQVSVFLDAPAPSGGLSLTVNLSDTMIANVPTTCVVPEGQSLVSFDVTAQSVAKIKSATLTITDTSATLTTDLAVSPWFKAILVSPTTLHPAETGAGLVVLRDPAPPGGITVHLSSSAPTSASVPATVTVPEGALQVGFAVLGHAVTGNSTLKITGVDPDSATLTQSVTVEPWLKSLDVAPAILVGSLPAKGTITLRVPVIAGGVLVTLKSNLTTVATVPSSVTVPAGQTSADFSITTVAVNGNTSVNINATSFTFTLTKSLSLQPWLQKVTVATNPVTGGMNTTGTVVLNDKAPTGGKTIMLISAKPAVVAVPASVVIPAGQTSVDFPVTTKAITADTTVRLTATYGARHATVDLKVKKP